jgi:hypothetical protein
MVEDDLAPTRRRGLIRREAREVRAVASAGSVGAAGNLLIGVLGRPCHETTSALFQMRPTSP